MANYLRTIPWTADSFNEIKKHNCDHPNTYDMDDSAAIKVNPEIHIDTNSNSRHSCGGKKNIPWSLKI